MNDTAQMLVLAEQAARAAGAVLLERFHQERTIEFKDSSQRNIVTDADHASEAVIIEHITRGAPGHAIIAEERGEHGSGDFVWHIDPLDGTTNYAHGIPHFCISIGVEKQTPEPHVIAGVVYDPVRDELFSAREGRGAHLNTRPLGVSATDTLKRAVLCTGFPYDLQQRPDIPLGLFSQLVRRAGGIRRMGSAALDLAWLAAGRFDGFFEFGLRSWDIAAGALLIQEAGGVMRRVDGAPFRCSNGDVLAANQALFSEMHLVAQTFLSAANWSPR